jgi:N-acyl-D-aspartate/D-glutamate deacylase
MKQLLRESMDAGCFGLSTGLTYYPGMYAHTDELVALARVVGESGGRYVTHLRGYCSTLPQSVKEVLSIAQSASVPVQVSHLYALPLLGRAANLLYYAVNTLEAVNKVIPLPAFPNPVLSQALKLIDGALAMGLDIGMDAVPYMLGNTTVTTLFPPWANRGGVSRLLERLQDSDCRRRMEADTRTVTPVWPHWEEGSWSDPCIKAIGWKPIRVLSVRSDKNRWVEGKSFPEIARRWKVSAFEALCRLTLEEEGQATFTFGYPARPWTEKMFNQMLRHPQMSIGADSVLPEFGTPPPSAYGCFPRVLGHYCRDLQLFSLPEAVYKMTGLSAKRYGLPGRGEIKKGSYADIVIFDPGRINEQFTQQKFPAYSSGISHVFINGQPVLWEGTFREALRPGRVLRKV